MKKILLLQIIVLMPLIAETGKERAIGESREGTCSAVRKKAYSSYRVFQMNAGCVCEQNEKNKWICEIYFSHMGKKK